MRRKAKGLLVGMLAMSMVATAPISAFAGQAGSAEGVAITTEVRAKKPDTGKTDTAKP